MNSCLSFRFSGCAARWSCLNGSRRVQNLTFAIPLSARFAKTRSYRIAHQPRIAARKEIVNSADLTPLRESIVREFARSAQAAGRGSQRSYNSVDLAASRESVVRELVRR